MRGIAAQPDADHVKRVSIFKPGRHTSANGTTLDFSEEQLAASIAAYDPAKHEAPLVIGHPKDNGPAWGWVGGLAFAEGEVVADSLRQVDPVFSELVESGKFKKVSASWYTPDSPSNPVPGVYYLRHIGFLGAMPPSIKGLSAVQFAEDEQGVVEFTDLSPWTMGSIASLVRRLREFFLVKHGQEDADSVLPSYLIEDLEAEAARLREAANTTTPIFTEDTTMTLTPEQIAQLQADHAASQARVRELEGTTANFSERETALAAREHAAQVATITADLGAHVKAGRVLPIHVPALAEFMANLPADGEVVEFGEPVEGKVPKISPRAFMTQFLAQLPKAVDFGEHAGGTGPSATKLTAQALADKAQAHVLKVKTETGRDLSYVEAVNHVIETEGAG